MTITVCPITLASPRVPLQRWSRRSKRGFSTDHPRARRARRRGAARLLGGLLQFAAAFCTVSSVVSASWATLQRVAHLARGVRQGWISSLASSQASTTKADAAQDAEDQHGGAGARGMRMRCSQSTSGRQRIAEDQAQHQRNEEAAGPAQHRQHGDHHQHAQRTLRTFLGMCSRTCGGCRGPRGARQVLDRLQGSGSEGMELTVFSNSGESPFLLVPARKRFAHGTELAPRHGQGFFDPVQAHRPALAFLGVEVLLERAHRARATSALR